MIEPMTNSVRATRTEALRPSTQSDVKTGWNTAEHSTKEVLAQYAAVLFALRSRAITYMSMLVTLEATNLLTGSGTGRAFASIVKSRAIIKLMLRSPAKASHVRVGIWLVMIKCVDMVIYVLESKMMKKFKIQFVNISSK